MNILIVEDDPVSGMLLKTILTPYGHCEIAVDGAAAIRTFDAACTEGKPFGLVCLDIMLPELNGQEVLTRFRDLETGYGITGLDRVKVIMVTALGDNVNVMTAFRSQCEGYIVKPIRKEKVIDQLKALEIIPTTAA